MQVQDSDSRSSGIPSPSRAISRSQQSAPLLRLLVFVGGFASIGVELTMSRLIAPYFGSSTFIWASLIGLTLTFLALGYYLGGRAADRWPHASLLYMVMAIAAIAVAAIPLAARPLLLSSLEAFSALDASAFYGTLAGTLLLLAVPVTLLGFASPFAIRLRLVDVDSAGNTAGSLYALSTLGSIAGSFLPVLLLIPWLGAKATLVTLSLLLLLPALAGLLILRSRTAAAMLTVFAIAVSAITQASGSGIRPADRGTLLHEEESAYNYIQVVDENGSHELILNEGRAVHSIYHPDQLLTGGPWDYFMAAPLLVADSADPAPENALIIGLAGGTTARQLTAAFGPISITGVEIDPSIVQVARNYFGLDDLANLTVDVEDGRYALRTSQETYDLIGIDAYRQPYIPFQLTTREFFQDVQSRLNPGGVAVVNAGRTQTDYRLVDALAATLRDVFPHVLAIDVGRYNNTMLIASDSPLSTKALSANVDALPADSPVREVSQWILESGNAREIEPGGMVFTDDHAPVELVIDTMILDAAREITGGAP